METIDTKIETGLQILDEKETSLIELKARCSGLKISGIEDKQGFKEVREARLTLKDARVQIQKDGKSLRENAIRFQKAVIEKENQLISIIAPIEKELQQEEEFYNSLVEQERIKKEREENDRIQKRIDALAKFNHGLDVYEAKIMPEENFQALLGHAEAEYLKEQERIKAEEAEKEHQRKQEEEALKIEREALARQRAEQEARERELQRQEQERIEAARKQEAAMRAEQEKFAAERKAFEDQKAKEAAEKKRAEEIEQARLKAIEDEKLRVKREAEEKAERERLAKIEAERQEALKPDKEKLMAYSRSLHELIVPELKDKKAIEILKQAENKIDDLCVWINEKSLNL